MAQTKPVPGTEQLTVTREVRIDASPDTVFEFFTDEQNLTQWMGRTASIDPRVGGEYRLEVTPGSVASGRYTIVDRPHTVAFTWGWEGDGQPVPPGSSLVKVTLTPDGDGTLVHLEHSGLPSQEMMDAHTEGWEHYLARLKIAAAGGDPGPDSFAEES